MKIYKMIHNRFVNQKNIQRNLNNHLNKVFKMMKTKLIFIIYKIIFYLYLIINQN